MSSYEGFPHCPQEGFPIVIKTPLDDAGAMPLSRLATYLIQTHAEDYVFLLCQV
jgi:hypothetical protein